MTSERIEQLADDIEQLAVMYPEYASHLEDAATLLRFVAGALRHELARLLLSFDMGEV